MNKPRTFDEHLRLYVIFGRAVAAFDQAAWKRIAARCVAFDEASVLPMFERARLLAVPHSFPANRFGSALPLPFRVLSGVLQVVHTGMFLGYELSQQIPALRDDAPSPRINSTGDARLDRYRDADHDIELALATHAQSTPTVRAAVRAAGQAVLHHDFLSDSDFARSYFAVAPEIPFAELEGSD